MLQAVWIEIPVKDIERALKFYQAVFDLPPMEIMTDDVRRTVTLYGGSADGIAGFSLNQTANFEPSDKGPFVYLYSGEDLVQPLGRVEAAGGKVVAPKTSMGSAGNFASIVDTEGNVVGLYSAE